MTSPIIDIWLTNLADVTDYLRVRYQQLLSAEELIRFHRFMVTPARDHFLVSRALLRTVLSRYADNVAPLDWQFTQNAYGKPAISVPVQWCGLSFNLSHTNGLVVCAISRIAQLALGVDVECLSRKTDYMQLAESVFAPVELAEMRQLTKTAQRDYFYSAWTLKEAYIKARGMGLSLSLDGMWFSKDAMDGAINIQFSPSNKEIDHIAFPSWQFFQQQVTPQHMLAVAAALSQKQKIQINQQWLLPLA